MLGHLVKRRGETTENWEGMVVMVGAKLSKWTWVLSQRYYREMVLVVNNLIMCMLCHTFIALETPESLLIENNGVLLEQTTLDSSPCPIPASKGGRPRTDWRVQSNKGFSSTDSIENALQCHRSRMELGYDRHLFAFNLSEVNVSRTTVFYQSVLRAWAPIVKLHRRGG